MTKEIKILLVIKNVDMVLAQKIQDLIATYNLEKQVEKEVEDLLEKGN